MNPFPIAVVAEILPGRLDPSASARFANASRAGQYADILLRTGDYSGVFVEEEDGTRHELNG